MTEIDKAVDEAKAAALPFESWEKVAGEKAEPFAAFCVFRDYGPERSIRKAVDSVEQGEAERERKHRKWRNWSALFRWRERAENYDQYREKLKQTEVRKTIEAQGEVHREITGKMLRVVGKKLDTMNAEDLTQNNVTEWAVAAIKMEREAAGLAMGKDGKAEMKQGELNFAPDFQGL